MLRTGGHSQLRGQILDLLATGPQSRADIARELRISRSTASANVASLIEEGIITPSGEDAGFGKKGAGRPSERLSLNTPPAFVVGIDFGRLSLKVAISDLDYKLIDEIDCEFDADVPAAEAIALAAQQVETLIERTGTDRSRIEAVGIGVPGPVDSATGNLHAGSILASWVGTDMTGELSSRLRLPVYMDNDANLGALAESKLGAAVGARVSLYVLLSVGVGLGITINGEVFRGANGIAGELGHVVTDEHGPLCRCGSRGCLEAQISVNALSRSLSLTHGTIKPAEMLRLAASGNIGAARVVADAGTMAGKALGALCNYFNPDLVLVGGELMRAGPVLLRPLTEAMKRSAIARATENVVVQAGALGERAEVYGTLIYAHYRAREAALSGPVRTDRSHAVGAVI